MEPDFAKKLQGVQVYKAKWTVLIFFENSFNLGFNDFCFVFGQKGILCNIFFSSDHLGRQMFKRFRRLIYMVRRFSILGIFSFSKTPKARS